MALSVSHAMVLAAGLGTRMRPLTDAIPKPLVTVRDKALIDWCLDWLAGAGIGVVVVNISYLAEKLEDHLAALNHDHVKVSHEPMPPLETGGGVLKALPLLGDGPFLTMNSDAIFPIQEEHPLTRMLGAWRDDLDFVLLLVAKVAAIGWESGKGDFVMDHMGRIRKAREGEDATFIFTGVEIIHPRVFEGCTPGAMFSLSKLWSANVDDEGFYTRVRAVEHLGTWVNVGDLPGLAAAETYFAARAASDGGYK